MKVNIQFNRLSTGLIVFLFLIQSLASFGQGKQTSNENSPKSTAVYELRIYYPEDGRLDDILKRFRDHTTGLFEKHGFTNIGYWVTRPGESPSFATRIIGLNDGKQALLYMVSFPDMKARNKAWDAFINDPEWVRVYEKSRENGPLVREIDQMFLNPTDFSGLK